MGAAVTGAFVTGAGEIGAGVTGATVTGASVSGTASGGTHCAYTLFPKQTAGAQQESVFGVQVDQSASQFSWGPSAKKMALHDSGQLSLSEQTNGWLQSL
mmetsp:Transcript_24698/g.42016  ORF Transcript_24698/g.42016 Transcript_24698/m.42016 type:complete len:100 (-) Transcript_24698:485-784(-)